MGPSHSECQEATLHIYVGYSCIATGNPRLHNTSTALHAAVARAVTTSPSCFATMLDASLRPHCFDCLSLTDAQRLTSHVELISPCSLQFYFAGCVSHCVVRSSKTGFNYRAIHFLPDDVMSYSVCSRQTPQSQHANG